MGVAHRPDEQAGLIPADARPAEVLGDYLRVGSLRGLLDPAEVDYPVLVARADDHWGEPGGEELVSVEFLREIDGEPHGLELKFYFRDRRCYADSVRSYGAPIDLCDFLDGVFARWPTGYEILLDEHGLDEGAVLFPDGQVLRFETRVDTADFVVHGVEGGYLEAREAEENLDWIRDAMTELDLIVDEHPGVDRLRQRHWS